LPQIYLSGAVVAPGRQRGQTQAPVSHHPVQAMLDCIEIDSPGITTTSVIWLHALGADGNDFVPIVRELGLPPDHGIRFVFPNAPVRPVSINAGMAMRAWYDISNADLAAAEDAAGINASRTAIEALIARENERGISARHIVLAGFSQGGAMALHTGLRHNRRLAGIMALSTYLPLRDTLAAQAAAANRDVPVFMAHGDADPVVAPQLAAASRDLLQAAGYTLAWHSFNMQHQVCAEEIHAIGTWLHALP